MAPATPAEGRMAPRRDWVRLAVRLLGLFALQGVVVLGLYGLMGPGTASTDLPLGLQLDPRHAVLHLGVGLSALAVAFLRPAWSWGYLLAFGLGYTALAALGTFTHVDFGMELLQPENSLHWGLGLGSLAVILWSAITAR